MRLPHPLTVLLAATIPAGPATAALPPAHQRLAEFRAALDHPSIAAALGGEPVTRIGILREDRYRVTGTRCHLDLAVVTAASPPGPVGPGASRCARSAGHAPDPRWPRTASASLPSCRPLSAAIARRMRRRLLEG